MSTPDARIPVSSPFKDDPACNTNACARDRIFQAAKNLFHRYGIRGVSVDAIAAEAGTTKVTLYRVFDSKDDLIVQVLKDQTKRVWEWWDSVVAQHPDEPREQIEALFTTFRDEICCDDAMRGCPLANAAVEVVEEDHPAKAIIREHELEIARRFRELCRAMGAAQPDALGNALSLLFWGVFVARLVFDGREQIATVWEAAKALLDSPTLGRPQKADKGRSAARAKRAAHRAAHEPA
jgi:AcrR family transcriptional regulator